MTGHALSRVFPPSGTRPVRPGGCHRGAGRDRRDRVAAARLRGGETLTASLLPEVHIAVLKISRLVPTLADALRMPEVRTASAGVIVTGPSRTADIEMTLTIGVHGPGELHVFLIDDSMPV